jgi:hypothetical protein
MAPDKVIYTDGHGVVVTDSNLKVKERVYSLRGVIHHGLWTVRASRFPGIFLILIGLIALVLGVLQMVSSFVPNMAINDNIISSNTIFIWVGIVFMAFGILWLSLARDKYAVRIATAEGERNAIISSKKEYISQIVTAINQAFQSSRDLPDVSVE